MPKQKRNINPEGGKRLSLWLNRVGVSAKALADTLHFTPQYISGVVTGKKRLTPDLADAISRISSFTTKNGEKKDLSEFDHVRANFLLLKDDYMTEGDRVAAHASDSEDRFSTLQKLLRLHNYSIENVTNEMPIETNEDGLEFQPVTFALVSPRGSRRFYTQAELRELFAKIDDVIDLLCAAEFRKLIDGVRNIHEWG